MEFEVTGEIWYWKGPAPHHFVTIPEALSKQIKEIAPLVTYGWGMIPVKGNIGGTHFSTALWEKDGRYILPLRASIRKPQGLEVGDSVAAHLVISIDLPSG